MNEAPPIETSPSTAKEAGITRILRSAALLAVLVCACIFGTMGWYVGTNESGHGSFDPWLLLIVFAPTFLLGIATIGLPRQRWIPLLACLTGLAGIALLWYLDHFDVLLPYERWIERGMP